MSTRLLSRGVVKSFGRNFSSRAHNFSAGPACLDTDIMQKIQEEFTNYNDSGMGIIEMSHRDQYGPVQSVIYECRERIRDLLQVPDNYSIFFMHGGAHLQFSAVSYNLKRKSLNNNFGAFVNTGFWSEKCQHEANKLINTKIIANSKDFNFKKIPTASDWYENIMDEVDNIDYVHICANETIYGLEYHYDIDLEEIFSGNDYIPPLVGDFTSTLFSRPVDVSKYGIIYASAGKNFGPAGVTIVISRNDLIADPGRGYNEIPGIMDYKEHCPNNNEDLPLYNTPPVFQIYTTNLILKKYQEDFNNDLKLLQSWQEKRVGELYDIIDSHGIIYHNDVNKKDRSLMNVPFRILNKNHEPDKNLEDYFTKLAFEKYGMTQVYGHYLFGGQRITCYNPVSDQSLDRIKYFMNEFAHENVNALKN